MNELTAMQRQEIINHANRIDNTIIGEYGIRFSRFFWDWCPKSERPELHYNVSWTVGTQYSTNDGVVQMIKDLIDSGYTETVKDDGQNITHHFEQWFENYVIIFDILECFD